MTTQIWKYELNPKAIIQYVRMPEGSKIVHVGQQNGFPCMWVLFSIPPTLQVPMITRRFRIFGTGPDVPENMGYVGTVLIEPYVLHIFEDTK